MSKQNVQFIFFIILAFTLSAIAGEILLGDLKSPLATLLGFAFGVGFVYGYDKWSSKLG